MGEEVLEFVIQVVNGEIRTKAEAKGQNDLFRGNEASSLRIKRRARNFHRMAGFLTCVATRT